MSSERLPTTTRIPWLIWIGLFLLAAAFRLYELRDVSAWYDEAATWKSISLPWSGMWESLQRNVHPPVYYVIVRLWALVFGDSVGSLRLFSVFCGLLTLVVVDLVAREAEERGAERPHARWPHLACWVYAFTPSAMEQSQQARMYALAILFAAGLGWGMLRVIRSPDRWTGWLALSVCGNLLPLTHYYGLWNSGIAALGVASLALWSPKQRLIACRWQWAVAIGITLVAWVGWLPVFLNQHSRVQAGYWIPRFTTSELLILGAEWSSSPQVRDLGLTACRWLCGLTCVSAIGVCVTRSPARWAIAAMAIGPPVLSTLYSLWTRNLLQGRYWCMAHLFYVVGFAVSIATIRSLSIRRIASGLLVLWTAGWSIHEARFRAELATRSGLRQCGEVLQQHRRASESIFVASPFYGPSIQLYLAGSGRVYILLPAEPLRHFQGQAIIPPAELQTLDGKSLAGSNRFWVVADELLSQTVQHPEFIPIPRGWKLASTRSFEEANRLPTRLELREYVRGP